MGTSGNPFFMLQEFYFWLVPTILTTEKRNGPGNGEKRNGPGNGSFSFIVNKNVYFRGQSLRGTLSIPLFPTPKEFGGKYKSLVENCTTSCIIKSACICREDGTAQVVSSQTSCFGRMCFLTLHLGHL